ncbi:ribosylnicotinamide kinase [Saccharomycopsis crataegensis]|uniref:Ribosylnicotinamide kinase n=1 Tax=Saccharomycopsis crataegensis TaxID=43959 RepID=A0AAV5QIZ2_9ASCO|nr:ribosylnicotinamide kinase [Saccharomycopsis crataegensis]
MTIPSNIESEEKVVLVGISGPSSSGKTTVSRLLTGIFPGSILIHEDDYYKDDKDIPMDEALGEQNWDCPEALDITLLSQHLKSLKHPNADPQPKLPSIQPESPSSVADPALIKQLKQKVHNAVGHENLRLVFLDGFLLYHEGSPLVEVLDVKLFLQVTFPLLKQRRESREGYQTKDSFWVDPPGYFEKLVWPNYVQQHQHMFDKGDVENGRCVASETLGIDVFSIKNEGTGIEEVLKWAVQQILESI